MYSYVGMSIVNMYNKAEYVGGPAERVISNTNTC